MKKSIFALCIIGSLASCTKDNSITVNTVAPLTKTEIITANNWVVSKVDISYNGATSDITADYLTECIKDDYVTFSKDKNVTMDAGSSKCDPSELQSVTGKWSFEDRESVIAMEMDNTTIYYDIIYMGSGSMIISKTDEDDEGNVSTAIYTYKKR